MGVTYRAEAPDLIVRANLGSIDALYHRRSGATHLVAAPVPQILDALGEGPADLACLMARLAARFELEDDAGEEDAGMATALAQRLTELIALGLVRADG